MIDKQFEDMVKKELKYPEEWDTVAYPTVWHALWEAYCWKAKALRWLK